jgi:hypothetical protein
MNDRRQGDFKPYSFFRSSRLVQEGNEWFFLAREGSILGPFGSRLDAENRLESYVKVAIADVIEPETKLSVVPFN